jgi:methionyl-tRNA synthetase
MLHLHGYILPDNVPANEFMNLEGDKMSTSRNWKLEMQDFIDDFVKKENGGAQLVDALRYYLTTISPESKDSEFTWKGFQDAVNNELVAIFGNFVNRSFVLMHKLCNGKVPPLHADVLDDESKAMLEEFQHVKGKVEAHLETYHFRDALFEVIDLARKGNQYMQRKEPWILVKTLAEHPEHQLKIDNCLHVCLQLTANLSILIQPFLPNTARKMLQMMKVVDKMLEWKNAGKQKLLSAGYTLRAPELLFRKIEDEEIQYQIDKLNKGRMAAASVAEATNSNGSKAEINFKPMIQFPDFEKIDLRIGTIQSAEKVEKADKLLRLSVDLGTEVRTIVSGIAEHFAPDAIIGKQVVVVANLAPRKMRGIESNGMILLASDAAGKLYFVSPETLVSAGARVS